MPFPYYESVEFTVNNGESDYNVDTQQSGFRSKFGSAGVVGEDPSRIVIRTNNTITVKINETTSDAITIASTDSPFVLEGIQIWNLYISNASGSNAAVKLLVQQSPYIIKP